MKAYSCFKILVLLDEFLNCNSSFLQRRTILETSVNRLIKTQIADEIYLVDDCSTDDSSKIAKIL